MYFTVVGVHVLHSGGCACTSQWWVCMYFIVVGVHVLHSGGCACTSQWWVCMYFTVVGVHVLHSGGCACTSQWWVCTSQWWVCMYFTVVGVHVLRCLLMYGRCMVQVMVAAANFAHIQKNTEFLLQCQTCLVSTWDSIYSWLAGTPYSSHYLLFSTETNSDSKYTLLSSSLIPRPSLGRCHL